VTKANTVTLADLFAPNFQSYTATVDKEIPESKIQLFLASGKEFEEP
jgi:hypothetical protein